MNENKITATTPRFIFQPAIYVFIKFLRFSKIKIGMATAGKIQAWNACENIISAGGRCSRKTEPKAKSSPTSISQRYNGVRRFLAFPV